RSGGNMKRAWSVALRVVSALFLVSGLSAEIQAWQNGHDRNLTQPVGATLTSRGETGKRAQPRSDIIMGSEEKLVRDAYTRLMRYQTAAVEREAAITGTAGRPEDYIVIELRHVRTGPLREIYSRPIGELVTASGDRVRVRPNHLVHGNGPPHAYYV